MASPKLAPELNARDLEMLQRLADLGMQLAELAGRQAIEEAASQPVQQTTKPPRPRRADPKLVFLRLWRAIQETIILKARLAAGILPTAPRPRNEPAPRPTPEPSIQAPNPPDDPRRALMLRYFSEAIDLTRQKRKTPVTRQDIENRIDAELAKDPHHLRPGGTVLLTICKSLDIPFYANRMHSDLLRPPRATSIGPP